MPERRAKSLADRLTPIVIEVRPWSWEVVLHERWEKKPRVVFQGIDQYQAHGIAQALRTYYRQHRPAGWPIEGSGLYSVAIGEWNAGTVGAPPHRHLHPVEG